MRLWHYKMIPNLPDAQLRGQHREICALRGNGWGKKHSTVDYVFEYSSAVLFYYHFLVMLELSERGVRIAPEWWKPAYRGRNCEPWADVGIIPVQNYAEHDTLYLAECILNLLGKNKVLNPVLDR